MDTETGEGNTPQEELVTDAATDALRDALGHTEAIGQEPVQPEAEEAGLPAEDQGLPPEIPPEGQPPEADTQPAEAEERLGKRRIRPRSELDQQVIDLYRSGGFAGTFAEATDVIYGRQAPLAQPQPVGEAPEPVNVYAEYDERAETLGTEITELETKIAEAAENLETTEAMNLQRELFRKEMQLSETKTEKERRVEDAQRSVEESHRRKEVESWGRAMKLYPNLGDANNVYRKEFDNYISRAERDPDYAVLFQSARWPEILGNEFAAGKGLVERASTEAAPQPPPHQAPQLGNQARVLTSGPAAQPVNAPATPEALLEGMNGMSNDQLYALLGQPDGKRVLR